MTDPMRGTGFLADGLRPRHTCTHCGKPGATLTVTNGFTSIALHDHYCGRTCHHARIYGPGMMHPAADRRAA